MGIKKISNIQSFESQNKSIYAISKIAADHIKAFQQKFGINYNIVRFFNVYGVDQKKFCYVKIFTCNKKINSLTVYGDGKQIRSFCNVDDAADGLIEVLFNGKKNTIYNIGNSNEPISILSLAKKIKQITKSSVPIKKISYDKSDRSINREIFKRIPSIKKISKDTSYFPKVNLEDGIRGLIKKKDNFDIKQKIGLGTLQWGLKYGIANKNGKLSLNEIKKVKKIAEKNHIDLLDTAHAYGDCEQRIGKVNFKNFNIVTKLPATEPGKNRYNWTLKSINDALKKFKTNKIYCIMFIIQNICLIRME